MQALGLIETKGLLPAIECLDVMLKTAQVELVERTFVGGGLVTIVVTGDVGAVKAAVDAGTSAVEKIDQLSLVASHIIARPHSEIDSMFAPNDPVEEEVIPLQVEEEVTLLPCATLISAALEPLTTEENLVAVTTIDNPSSAHIMLKDLHKAGVDALVQELGVEKSMNVLTTLSVVKLRNLSREYKDLGIAGRAISKANKDLLIQKLRGYYDRVSDR